MGSLINTGLGADLVGAPCGPYSVQRRRPPVVTLPGGRRSAL